MRFGPKKIPGAVEEVVFRDTRVEISDGGLKVYRIEGLSEEKINQSRHYHRRVVAVVGKPDELKGSAIAAFVTLEGKYHATEELKLELKEWVAKQIGALARPDDIRFTEMLPKTRSGKIMRRLLREIATQGSVSGDTTTLEDFSVLEQLRTDEE